MNHMLYFLLALTTAVLAASEPVLDTDGDRIFNGSYYVIPLVSSGSRKGGLFLYNVLPIYQCPLYVGCSLTVVDMGIPVRFSNWKSRVGFVPESENLNIELDTDVKLCPESTYWWLTAPQGFYRRRYIENGPKPKPGEDSLRSFFQIKKIGENLSGYKFTLCPESHDNYCYDIGFVKGGYRSELLGLTFKPLEVVFVKANGTETSPKMVTTM